MTPAELERWRQFFTNVVTLARAHYASPMIAHALGAPVTLPQRG